MKQKKINVESFMKMEAKNVGIDSKSVNITKKRIINAIVTDEPYFVVYGLTFFY